MHLCLFEDRAENLYPLTLTRPVFDLLCGMTSLGNKQSRAFGPAERGFLVRPALESLCRERSPIVPINDLAWLRSEPAVLINGRWLPPEQNARVPSAPCLGVVNGQVAYAVLTPAELSRLTPENAGSLIDAWKHELPCRPADGTMLEYPWDLVEHNGGAIASDFSALGLDRLPAQASSVAVVGPADQLCIAGTARVEPMVVANTARGPVVIDEGAVIHAFTRLEGPCYIGPMTQVFGANIRAGTSLGSC